MEQWILDNIQILLLVAFVALPLLFNKKRLKKKSQQGRQMPTAGPTLARPEETMKKGASLEQKVRQFFEEMVEGSQPKGQTPSSDPASTAGSKPSTGSIPTLQGSTPESIPTLKPDKPESIPTLRAPGSDLSRRLVHADPEAEDFEVIGADETASEAWAKHVEHGEPSDPFSVPPVAAPPAAGYGVIDREPGKKTSTPSVLRASSGVAGDAERSELPLWLDSLGGLSGENIRKAIIWKEILDKPVGLR